MNLIKSFINIAQKNQWKNNREQILENITISLKFMKQNIGISVCNFKIY